MKCAASRIEDAGVAAALDALCRYAEDVISRVNIGAHGLFGLTRIQSDCG